MVNQRNLYNNPDPRVESGVWRGNASQMSMQPPMPRQREGNTWQKRLLGNGGRPMTLRQEKTLPNWIVGHSVVFFFVAMIACWVVWGHPMEMPFAVTASLSVLLFFYGAKSCSQEWAQNNERKFIRNIFLIGLSVRLLWAMYCYFFFNPEYWENTYGDTADTDWYMPFAADIADWLRGESSRTFWELIDLWASSIDDIGYPIWLAIINILTFGESDVFVPFVVKCVVGAYCAVSIYHVAKRHFGEGAARIGALFVALNPNIIYWCGNMFKEAEFMFLCCLCIDLVDRTFTSGKKLTFRGLLPGVFVAFSLFFFRSALGIVMFLAMLAHIVMASGKVMSAGKKIIAGVLVAATLFVGMGDRLRSQAEHVFDTAQSDSQAKNMEWRANRKEASGAQQSFAKYASAAVFAPLIFTIPFPTFNVANEAQILQQQLSGGNFIKNILSFFVIYVMIVMLLTGEWRRHVFILAYTCGYLACLVLSSFAHSSRFHMPVWPMLMLFAAYGIQVAKTNARVRKWFPVVLVVEVVACLAWNWFKLKGRGMI